MLGRMSRSTFAHSCIPSCKGPASIRALRKPGHVTSATFSLPRLFNDQPIYHGSRCAGRVGGRGCPSCESQMACGVLGGQNARSVIGCDVGNEASPVPCLATCWGRLPLILACPHKNTASLEFDEPCHVTPPISSPPEFLYDILLSRASCCADSVASQGSPSRESETDVRRSAQEECEIVSKEWLQSRRFSCRRPTPSCPAFTIGSRIHSCPAGWSNESFGVFEALT